jgi:hypothetical protein
MAAHMKAQSGMTLQEAARHGAKSSLQFRWLDAPRSVAPARAGQAAGLESPVAAAAKADALDRASERVDEVLQLVASERVHEVLQQVLQRAILAEQKASILEASLKDIASILGASLKDMTAQRDKWVLQADDWKEQEQHAQRR